MILGRTGLEVNKTGFGALPIQRVSMDEAIPILRKAYDNGINYFDTARAYTDSEEKIGRALGSVRENIVIATKSGASDAATLLKHLETSLKLLKTDYIDVYQFHNPAKYPEPGDGTGMYEAVLEAKRQGKIRFIGITNHRRGVAVGAIRSGLYDVLQYPFSYLSDDSETELVHQAAGAGVGFVAMKALSGGLITNASAASAFMSQHENVLPIWGIEKEHELDEFIALMKNPPALDPELESLIKADRSALTGEFCRGCGYCMPCPENIAINTCARMSLLIRRSPPAGHLSESSQAMMHKVQNCRDCGQCAAQCPYGLDTPSLLRKNYEDYKEILAGKAPV